MHNKIPKDAHAMIIGAMKCGTSSLYDYLCGHPQICPAITKEPEYFSENQRHRIEAKSYSDLFAFDGTTHKYALDGSTGYTKYPLEPNAAKNIYDYGISPKFIYIVRNPFERIQSQYNFMRGDDKFILDITDEQLIHTSDYFMQLEQYRRYFPTSSILLLDFDELKSTPSTVLKKVYDFLNLSHDYFPDTYEVKNQTQHLSRLEKRIQKSSLNRLLRFLPGTTKNSLRSVIKKLSHADKKRVLTENERTIVFNSIKEGMRGLTEIYGFDSKKWGF